MVIGHKQGTDGDRNTWVPSVRISCCGFTEGKSELFQGTITSLCKLFRHENRFYTNTCPPSLHQQRCFLSSLLISHLTAVKKHTKKPPEVANSKYSFSEVTDCEFVNLAATAHAPRCSCETARDNSINPLHLPWWLHYINKVLSLLASISTVFGKYAQADCWTATGHRLCYAQSPKRTTN